MFLSRLPLFSVISSLLVACGGGGDSSASAPTFEQSNYVFSGEEDSVIEGRVIASGKGDNLSYTVANASFHGIFALNDDGSFRYQPDENFNGQETVQIQASFGYESSITTLTFDVLSVNDAPNLRSSMIPVRSSGSGQFQLSADDVDGDAIAFTLLQAPAIEQLTVSLSSIGEVTYEWPELAEVEGELVFSYTDGVMEEPIVARLPLRAAMATNEDKRDHYYSSSLSHLARAERIKRQLSDDTQRDQVNQQLVEAYYTAGYDATARARQQALSGAKVSAESYQKAALVMDALNLPLEAESQRRLALTSYNQLVSDRGSENITRDDVTFYLRLLRNTSGKNEAALTSEIIRTLNGEFDQVVAERYESIQGVFATAYRLFAEEMAAIYWQTPTEENRQQALSANQWHADVVARLGFANPTRGRNAGRTYHQQRVYHLNAAAERFYHLGALNDAKRLAAQSLALYGITGFGDAFPFASDPYFETTRELYPYGLPSLVGLFESLFSSDDGNLPLNLLRTLNVRERVLNDAEEDLFTHQIVRSINEGQPVDQAIEAASVYFAQDENLRSYFETLIEQGVKEPGAARLLFAQGKTDEALQVLSVASQLLASDEYQQQVSSTAGILGSGGCQRLVDLVQQMGGDLNAQVTECERPFRSLYHSDASVSTLALVTSRFNMLHIYAQQDETASSLITVADELMDLIARFDRASDRLDNFHAMAAYLLRYGQFDLAQRAFGAAMASFNTLMSSDEHADHIDALDELANDILTPETIESGGLDPRSGYLTELQSQVLQMPNYASVYADTLSSLKGALDQVTRQLLASPNETLRQAMSRLVAAHVYTEQWDAVHRLINHEVNTAVDQMMLWTESAKRITQKDDFPTSGIASVDTDHDGRPNFFHLGVSEQEIAESGLVLDNDSDNDGIPDQDDAQPLLSQTLSSDGL